MFHIYIFQLQEHFIASIMALASDTKETLKEELMKKVIEIEEPDEPKAEALVESNAGESAGFPQLEASAVSNLESKSSDTPITEIMSTVYDYGADQYKYKGFVLAYDYINKYYICERCFRVVMCNNSNAGLNNHSTRAICTGCTDKKEKRDLRIKKEFEANLAKLQEKQRRPVKLICQLDSHKNETFLTQDPVLCSTIASGDSMFVRVSAEQFNFNKASVSFGNFVN
ncbi:hypothetical protein B566_EDAN017608 [Ephemera danica]|nr:hypothetical protein B566_EDAN017608 [Ephemera danica]